MSKIVRRPNPEAAEQNSFTITKWENKTKQNKESPFVVFFPFFLAF